ncbi:MAG: hypothetical protein EHM35_04380 [Planctomycetaceae bacterium]|nr:MAG: hypothetical protein EHM35_04380 [Planctomycetaceae bacterium]
MPCDGLGPKGTPVMTRTHATASAFSYGRRYLRCAIFNVITADMAKSDDDGNAAGRVAMKPLEPLITELQLKDLNQIIEAAGIDPTIFLDKYKAGALSALTKSQYLEAWQKCKNSLPA